MIQHYLFSFELSAFSFELSAFSFDLSASCLQSSFPNYSKILSKVDDLLRAAVLQFPAPQSLNILYALCPLCYVIFSEEGNDLHIKEEVNE